MTTELHRLLATFPEDTLTGLRDQALLRVGFGGGFRRSDLVALDVADLHESNDGLRITVRQSKTDQEGVRREVEIPHGQHPEICLVRTLRAWGSEGSVFWEVHLVCPERFNTRGERGRDRDFDAAGDVAYLALRHGN